jgi:hypothetical protein
VKPATSPDEPSVWGTRAVWLNRPDSVVPASLDSDHAGLEVDVGPAEGA